jgi:hypothetical protein
VNAHVLIHLEQKVLTTLLRVSHFHKDITLIEDLRYSFG